jgi:hypothetical protein
VTRKDGWVRVTFQWCNTCKQGVDEARPIPASQTYEFRPCGHVSTFHQHLPTKLPMPIRTGQTPDEIRIRDRL